MYRGSQPASLHFGGLLTLSLACYITHPLTHCLCMHVGVGGVCVPGGCHYGSSLCVLWRQQTCVCFEQGALFCTCRPCTVCLPCNMRVSMSFVCACCVSVSSALSVFCHHPLGRWSAVFNALRSAFICFDAAACVYVWTGQLCLLANVLRACGEVRLRAVARFGKMTLVTVLP